MSQRPPDHSERVLQARGRVSCSSWFMEGLRRWLSVRESVRTERGRPMAKHDQHNRMSSILSRSCIGRQGYGKYRGGSRELLRCLATETFRCGSRVGVGELDVVSSVVWLRLRLQLRLRLHPASDWRDSRIHMDSTSSALVGANIDGDSLSRGPVLAVRENMVDWVGLCANVGNLGAGSVADVYQADASVARAMSWHFSSFIHLLCHPP